MKTNALLLATLFGALSSAACLDPMTDISDDTADESADSSEAERIAVNSLTPAQLVPLNPVKLTQTGLNAMAATASGRATLQYTLHCALSAGTTVTATVNNVQYPFAGGIGIAPSWQTSALTAAQQNWVSACVLARVNLYGDSKYLSMRGSLTPALDVTATEATSYQVQEGAFFGSIFTGGANYLVACMGTEQAAADDYSDLPSRECAEPGTGGYTQCSGVRYAGLCSSVCTWNVAGYYTGCVSPHGTTYNEVVTAFLSGVPQ